jgi:general secretion pathway protein G
MLLTQVRSARRRATRRAAFTLLEVLIVVAILVILASSASIALFKYLEDAKVGRAKNDMRVIEQAYKKHYTEKLSWPSNIQEVASQLEQGQQGLLDPWGNMYNAQVVEVQMPDGTSSQRPLITCQPPGGKPQITWPEK